MSECKNQKKAFDIYEGYNMAVFIPKIEADVNIRILSRNDFELLCYKTTEIIENPGVNAIFIERDFLHDISKALFKKRNVNFKTEKIILNKDTKCLLELFTKEAKDKQIGYKLILKSLSIQIAVNLLRQTCSNLLVMTDWFRYTENENINRVIDYFLECYDEDYSLEDVAKTANLSPYHFIRVFKAQTGKTPYKYFMDIKIKKARELFEAEGYNVTEVCFLCGFANVSHFCTVFKKKVGTSPMEYRKIVSGL